MERHAPVHAIRCLRERHRVRILIQCYPKQEGGKEEKSQEVYISRKCGATLCMLFYVMR